MDSEGSMCQNQMWALLYGANGMLAVARVQYQFDDNSRFVRRQLVSCRTLTTRLFESE